MQKPKSRAWPPGTKMISHGVCGVFYVAPTTGDAAAMRRQGFNRVLTLKTACKWFPDLFGEEKTA